MSGISISHRGLRGDIDTLMLCKKGAEKNMTNPFKLPNIDVKCQECFYFPQSCIGLRVHTASGCEEQRKKMQGKRGGK
ncbi:hypothetical protein [Desulforamulus aquiferis]|uniref:Uncharacterized protein n=1 Tax=Desulforamulus aquiferis TaxID=1397668 RepID=A0AAW7ZL72_9FIRM|nr:hypothetical protein [Desulforamulus aquiferis]MDO7789141.1 hypothetical protein [Desulforamulus aquiferis]